MVIFFKAHSHGKSVHHRWHWIGSLEHNIWIGPGWHRFGSSSSFEVMRNFNVWQNLDSGSSVVSKGTVVEGFHWSVGIWVSWWRCGGWNMPIQIVMMSVTCNKSKALIKSPIESGFKYQINVHYQFWIFLQNCQ